VHLVGRRAAAAAGLPLVSVADGLALPPLPPPLPSHQAIADAAAAAVKSEENKLRTDQAGERRGAKNLQTALTKGFGCGLASKLRSEGSPFDASYSASLRSIVASIVAAWFF